MRECVHDFFIRYKIGRMTVAGFGFFLGPNKKKAESKIYCRLSLSFSTVSLVRIRSHKAVQILNLNQIRKQLRNFLRNDATSKIQLLPISTAIHLWLLFSPSFSLRGVVFATWNHFTCFMVESPIWIFKSNIMYRINVSFSVLSSICEI